MRRDALPEAGSGAAALPHTHGGSGWPYAIPALLFALIWTLIWYRSTGAAMIEIWRRSETFTHGFLVLPIVLWLVWRMRAELARVAPRPAWWALPIVAACVFAWLLGELAAVNALTQFALIALLVAIVIAVLGTAVARKLAFPLAFLFFAVPIGDFLMPRLITWTADFTILGLRLSGIPVYREGQQFVIPSGRWSVVEACSGIRYLIASLMVGTLFAYLTYRSLARRLIFIAVAAAVPIVANWARAYIIVMLGHISGNKIAAGVDHLIYGWLFFGVVIAVLFWIGSRWREDDETAISAPTYTPRIIQETRASTFGAALAAVALIVLAGKFGYWAIERSDAAAPPRLAAVNVEQNWAVSSHSFESWRPHFANPSAELQQVFRNGDNTVGLFLGYYRNQDYDSKLVSSTNVLVRSSDQKWVQTGAGDHLIEIGGEPLTVRTLRLRSASGDRMVVWQWYWINGRWTASDPRAKAYTALSRLQGRGDDSAVVVMYALEDQPGGGARALQAFANAAAAPIEAALRQTRDQR